MFKRYLLGVLLRQYICGDIWLSPAGGTNKLSPLAGRRGGFLHETDASCRRFQPGNVFHRFRNNPKTVTNTESYDSYTKLMLHMEGSDGSTTFTDEIGKAVTANGNAQIDTAQKKFGAASGLFDGTGDYLTLANSNDWSFGSGDFTIDFWVNHATTPTSSVVINYYTAGGIRHGTSNKVLVYGNLKHI